MPTSPCHFLRLLLLAATATVPSAVAQSPHAPGHLITNPLADAAGRTTPDPSTPPPQQFHDPRYGLSFDLPAGWNLSRRDGDFSTFGLDARSSVRSTQMRAVADIAFNPFPQSTFSGALFYFSVTPHATPVSCSNQSTAPAPRVVSNVTVDGTPFTHGYDEHGAVCTEARDEVYTALRDGACLRFDLVINTFCGGEVSGSRDMTPAQLDSVRKRLESILSTVRLRKPQDVLRPRLNPSGTD